MDDPRWGIYSSCCRLCLENKLSSLRSIFEDVVRGKELVEQIHNYIGVMVKAGDKLSTMICEQCLSKVHMWNIYKKSCFDNQDKLNSWMNAWEAQNVTETEVQIKLEAMDQSYDNIPMEEDIYDEPPPLTPYPPETNSVDSIENDPLAENEIMAENETIAENKAIAENIAIAENEINQNEKESSTLNGMVARDLSAICSFCDKSFSNRFNRRRHERDVHNRKSSPLNQGASEILPKNANEADVQKIEFAAGLQLKRCPSKLNNSISEFTNVEVAYLEKYKNIIMMMDTLKCVCHNEKFNELKELFIHLKTQRSWFAMFTCYNCLITFCDRVAYMRHYCSCAKELLYNLRHLSEFSRNSKLKIRIYQNFRCLKCSLTYAFYEDFCDHLDQDHMEISQDSSPYTCICSETFQDITEIREHINASCFIGYYCDACFTTYSNIDAFKKHCENEHDNMNGDSLDMYDYYRKSKFPMNGPNGQSDGPNRDKTIITRRRTLVRTASEATPTSVCKQEVKEYSPKPRKVLNPHAFRNMKSSKPASCPDCDKMYSSYHNMLRHYTLAHDESGLILTCTYCPEKFRLISELNEHEGTVHDKIVEEEKSINEIPKFSCPDCKSMFKTSEEWKKHTVCHPKQACEECGKLFNLKSDLEQHRSVHLNIKVYKDSKTQSYKSTMLSPTLSCLVCDITFDNNEEMLKHRSLHDKMPKLTIQSDSLQEEKKDDSRKYSCTPCKKNYLSYAGIYDHIKKHHPDQETVKEFPKKCVHCDKVLLTRGAYGNHQRMHDRLMGLIPKIEVESPKVKPPKTPDDEESYYTCKKCFKVFSRKYNLKNHMKSHGISINTNRSSVKTGKVLKTYWCDICHQACIGYTELQEHKLGHRHVKPKVEVITEPDLPQSNPFIFVCDICNASYATTLALKRHKETHGQEIDKQNTVYCKYCRIPFVSAAAWNEHMLSEHDETVPDEVKPQKNAVKKHACKICKKVFDNGGALASHQGWHKRGRIAKKMFNDIKPIKTEFPLQVPTIKIEAKGYECSSCGLHFVNETALQIHILETHRNITRILSLNCSSCCTSFDSKAAFDTHMALHKVVESQRATTKPFPCKYCTSRFSRSDTLNAHVKQHHSPDVGDIFNCTQCDRTFNKQTALTLHLKVHERHSVSVTGGNEKFPLKPTPNQNLFCSICKLRFAAAKDLRIHVITMHPF